MENSVKNTTNSKFFNYLFLAFTVFVLLNIIWVVIAQAKNNQIVAEGPNCRYGVASFRESDNPYIDQLNAGWAIDFKVNPSRVLPTGVEYVPVIRLKQDKHPETGQRLDSYSMWSPGSFATLGNLVDSNPGKIWFIGNEVDRHTWQDDMYPQVYAKAYHEIYHFIKDRDPSAIISISGLVEVTPGRLQYLDIVWDTYLELYNTPMPVDVWNMHIYILPEIKDNGFGSNAAVALGTDPSIAILESYKTNGQGHYDCARDDVYCFSEHDNIDIFIEQATAMRQWMKNHGQQDKPLILSEFSTLYPYDQENDSNPETCFLKDENGQCFTENRVNQFMNATFNYLESATDPNLGYPNDNYRLVQNWLWFAMNEYVDNERPEIADSSNKLIDIDASFNPTGFSPLGNNFKNYVDNQTQYINLHPISATNTAVYSTTSTTIGVEIINNGNKINATDYTVTFYSDENLTSEIGSTVVTENLNGCAIPTQTAQISWSGLVPGANRYWAVIDDNLNVTENDETDNVISGVILVNPEQVFLPTILR